MTDRPASTPFDLVASPRALAWARLAVGAAALAKSLGLADAASALRLAQPRLPATALTLPDSTPTVAVALLVVGGAAMLWRPTARVGAVCVVVGGALPLLWDLRAYSNHLVLLVALAAVLVLAGPGDRRQRRATSLPWAVLLTTQVSVVYLFSGLSKLNGSFLHGGVLAAHLRAGPLRDLSVVAGLEARHVVPLAFATVFVEVALAVLLWLPGTRRTVASVGIGLHTSIVLSMEPRLELAAFALLCLGTYPLFLGRQPRAPRRPTPPGSFSEAIEVAAVRVGVKVGVPEADDLGGPGPSPEVRHGPPRASSDGAMAWTRSTWWRHRPPVRTASPSWS